MSTWVKVCIAGGILVVLILVVAIAGGLYWWSTNGKQLIAQAGKAVQEGKEFGAHTDNQGCVSGALTRYKQNKGFGGALSTSLFLKGCLDGSRPTPGFCDSVPKELEFTKSAEWRIRQCSIAGVSDEYCPQIFSQVQKFCASRP
jgi:hypothetical protein